jgi:class 3 adenylate cyclase
MSSFPCLARFVSGSGQVRYRLADRQLEFVAGRCRPGNAVNTASRVQAAAEPGWVLVDAATQRLAEAVISFTDTGEHALKGKAVPQRLWRATWVLSGGSAACSGSMGWRRR